jgi:hypothetical protein
MDYKAFVTKYKNEIRVGVLVFIGLMILQLFKSFRD